MKIWAILLLGCFVPGLLAISFNATQFKNQITSDPQIGYLVNDIVQTPDHIFPGDQVTLKMSFYTAKAEAQNVVVTASTPLVAASSTFLLGTIQKDAHHTVEFTFTVPTSAKPGTYPAYIYASDASTPQKLASIIQVGVNAQVVSGMLVAKVSPESVLEAGSSTPVDIEITNTGNLEAQNVIVELANTSSVLTALDTDRKYLASIASGATEKIPFTIGVTASATPGYYPLSVNIHYNTQVSQIDCF